MCDPPVNPTCPEGGAPPSFAGDVYPNVFFQYCVTCHSSTGQESSMPLTNYTQIYGLKGVEAGEIFTQVFEDCLMPPSNATVPLTDDAGDAGDADALGPRQTLLNWLACGAPNN